MGAHAFLARRLTGAVFFGGFVLLAIVGSLHQAHKLEKRLGSAFRTYLHQTSAVPFLAMLRGRQSPALAELPWKTIVVGTSVVVGLYPSQKVRER
jgi:uncharacterized membrane protein